MEYWVFNKKEMNLIADLMVNELVKMPDNSYISMMELFQRSLNAEYVDGYDKSGYRVNGYKISDITMPKGKRISDAIKWNFEDGVWYDYYSQGFKMFDMFERKVHRKGYIIDWSESAGLKLGLHYYIRFYFRQIKHLISSFDCIEECVFCNSNQEKYYSRKSSDERKEIQLLRVPSGCNTGKNEIKGRLSCFVVKGKCEFNASEWQYGIFHPKRKAEWREIKTKVNLKIYQSKFVKKNHIEEIQTPSEAWFQITNIGKSDLLVYVVDIR